MLNGASKVQEKHLAGGMLPFNCDETYVSRRKYFLDQPK